MGLVHGLFLLMELDMYAVSFYQIKYARSIEIITLQVVM
jgi:hypothetical protein